MTDETLAAIYLVAVDCDSVPARKHLRLKEHRAYNSPLKGTGYYTALFIVDILINA